MNDPKARSVFANIIAPYGRSVAALVCGIFTARWLLSGLGSVEYGLLGVVAGMAGFVTLINTLLVNALTRYYSVALGENRDDVRGVRAWFTAGTVVVLAISTLLVAIGYPVGVYAVRHWLTIPTELVDSCVCVWRWSCLGCWAGMAVSPWFAMYTAKQRLVSLSGYAFAATLVTAAISAWIAFHPGNWFVKYFAAITIVAVIQYALVFVRGSMRFAECRFVGRDGLWGRVGELLRFAALNSVQAIGWLLSNNGMAVLVNKLYGPVMNGSLSISNSVKIHSSQLSASVQGAFNPVISTAYGAGDMDTVRKLALRVSKLATASIAVFVIPLAVGLDVVLELWLKTPPQGTWELCLMALVIILAEALGVGYRTAIYATGKIGRFAAYGESVLLFTLPVAGVMWWAGFGIWSIGLSYLLVTIVNVWARVVFARKIFDASIRDWIVELVIPVLAGILISGLIGVLVVRSVSSSLAGLVLSSAVIEVLFVPVVWFFVCNRDDRDWMLGLLRKQSR